MSEGDPGPEDTGGSGGSFWTSLPTLLTASAVFISAVVGAVVTLRSQGDGDGGGGGGATTTQAADTTTTAQTGLSEHFVEATRPGGRNYFDGETMFVKVSSTRPVLVLAEGDQSLQDVRMTVHAERTSGADDYGIGLICRYASPGNYYLLAVLNGSDYHIVRYRDGRAVSLTQGIQPSDAIDGDTYDIDARCVGSDPALLTLSVGGEEVASIQDPDGIEEGNVGIRVGTSESVVTCAFRDYTLRSL
jgi:hypothetical protein